MRFVRCGTKLFKLDSVVAVDLYHRASHDSKSDAVVVLIPGTTLTFHGAAATAVREFFLSMPATDLMRRDEPEAPELPPLMGSQWPPEPEAPNHSREEC